MDLQQRIDADIKAAMLARDKDRLNALRAIKSAILLELTKEGPGKGIDEATGMRILQKLHKQRQESAAIYRGQQRDDLAAEEEAQASVIEVYLPRRMDMAELEASVIALIGELGAHGMKDMGRVMGEANKRWAGQADGSAIAALVQKLLGSGCASPKGWVEDGGALGKGRALAVGGPWSLLGISPFEAGDEVLATGGAAEPEHGRNYVTASATQCGRQRPMRSPMRRS